MPITIILPEHNGTWVGPGADIQAQSSIIGPLPADSQWDYEVLGGADEQSPWIEHVFQNTNPSFTTYLVKASDKNTTRTRNQPADGDAIQFRVQLIYSGQVQDSGQVSTTWRSTQALGQQAFLQPSATVASGAFTEQDRALLTAAELRSQVLGVPADLYVQSASGPIPFSLAQLFARNSLDQLVLEEMTSGPTCDPVRIELAPVIQYGIVVRITTVPDDLVFKTPDLEWTFPDLAVLRIFRGEYLTFRRGIHTPTFETDAPWEWAANPLNKNLLGVPPPATFVYVDWRAGVCGQVFIRHMP